MDEFPVGKITHTGMWDVIKASAAAGDYCFDEMFVWATELIDRHPVIVTDIRARFRSTVMLRSHADTPPSTPHHWPSCLSFSRLR